MVFDVFLPYGEEMSRLDIAIALAILEK